MELNGLPPPPPERLLPDEPFPPYSYVPGLFPHPFSDPAGHSFGGALEKPAPLDPDRWRQSPAFCRGIDLFNHGFYWEAHEVWEGLWHQAGRRGALADLLKGLIKLAAAGVKAREGRVAGLHRHAVRAAQLFAAAQNQSAAAGHAQPRWAGLDLAELRRTAEVLAARPDVPAATSKPVERVLDVWLRPE